MELPGEFPPSLSSAIHFDYHPRRCREVDAMDSFAWCSELPLGGYYVTLRRGRPVLSLPSDVPLARSARVHNQRERAPGPDVRRATSVSRTTASEDFSEGETEDLSRGMSSGLVLQLPPRG